jgi:hypothetical protein
MNSILNKQTARPHRIAGIGGHVLSPISLLVCLMFWIDFFYANAAEEPLLKFTGLEWFKAVCAAVALAGMATALRSRLWRVALPISLTMFLFTMHLMGS